MVVSNKVYFDKKGFKYFIDYKDTKKLSLYAHFFQKWVNIEETLIKRSICFFKKRWWNVRKIYRNLGKKLEIVSKKNLIVNLYTMKYILKLK